MAEAWSDFEIRVALDAYFVMLILELQGVPVPKPDVRAQVGSLVPARSDKSIEFKWCNISAVLDDFGLRWAASHKPLSHYQERLRELTASWLMDHPYVRSLLTRDATE